MPNKKTNYPMQDKITTLIKKHKALHSGQVAEALRLERKVVIPWLTAMVHDKILTKEGTRPVTYRLSRHVKASEPAPVEVKRPIFDRPVFAGVDWGTSTMRPGCQDHLQHPSRRGNALVPYRAPILNAASKGLHA